MTKHDSNTNTRKKISAQPRLHQRAAEIQAYGTVNHLLPLELEEPVRLEMTAQLNQLLADTMTLRDLYKKSHWQVAGPTFYQLHLLFDKHFDEQVELVELDCGTYPTARRRQHSYGGGRGRDDADRTASPRPGGGSRAALAPAGCTPDHHSSESQAGETSVGTWRRWHQ